LASSVLTSREKRRRRGSSLGLVGVNLKERGEEERLLASSVLNFKGEKKKRGETLGLVGASKMRKEERSTLGLVDILRGEKRR